MFYSIVKQNPTPLTHFLKCKITSVFKNKGKLLSEFQLSTSLFYSRFPRLDYSLSACLLLLF